MSKRSILLITSETIPAKAGDGRSAFFLSQELGLHGVESSILTLGNGTSGKARGTKSNIIFTPYYPKSFLGKIISRILFAINLLRHGVRFRVWIIYGGMLGNRIAIIFGFIFGRRVIFRSTLWGFDNISTLEQKNPLNRLIYSLAWGYWALNQSLADDYKRTTGGSRIMISPQGVPDFFFSLPHKEKGILRKGLNLPEGIPIIISIGHIIGRKGFPEIFQWLALLNQPFLYLILGEHNPTPTDRMYSKREEMLCLYTQGQQILGEKIRFEGVRKNVQDYLYASDIFLHGSLAEGFPNALSEALACGLPSVVRRIEGVNELELGEAGVRFFTNHLDLEHELNQLLTSTELRAELGSQARGFAQANLKLCLVASRLTCFALAQPYGQQ